MEPAIALEILGNQRRTAHLAPVIAHQAAVGLGGETPTWAIPVTTDRIQRAGHQGHQQGQAQCRAYISIHGGLLRPGAGH
ncbi:hypothetical protein PPS11_32025 [Pseudomonas putida S11]|nr:hypothetical protein PPS11_32025 [Pseudomonas putida S11]